MKFKTFALSFADLEKGKPFSRIPGALQIANDVSSPLLRDLLQKFPWQSHLVIDTAFEGENT